MRAFLSFLPFCRFHSFTSGWLGPSGRTIKKWVGESSPTAAHCITRFAIQKDINISCNSLIIITESTGERICSARAVYQSERSVVIAIVRRCDIDSICYSMRDDIWINLCLSCSAMHKQSVKKIVTYTVWTCVISFRYGGGRFGQKRANWKMEWSQWLSGAARTHGHTMTRWFTTNASVNSSRASIKGK